MPLIQWELLVPYFPRNVQAMASGNRVRRALRGASREEPSSLGETDCVWVRLRQLRDPELAGLCLGVALTVLEFHYQLNAGP